MSFSPIGSKTDMSLQEKQSKKKKHFIFFDGIGKFLRTETYYVEN